MLGGSVYYLIAGIALLASAWFLFRGRLLGGWIYIGSVHPLAIWGFAESRGNAWAMVPWLVAPLVILISVLLVMPTLTRADVDGASPAAGSRLQSSSSRRASPSSARPEAPRSPRFPRKARRE